MATNLTDAAIRKLAPGVYRDSGLGLRGASLELRVSEKGKRTFDLTYRDEAGKRCRLGAKNFGEYKGEWHATHFPVAAARRVAREAWRQICGGRDFVAERREEKHVPTVHEAAEDYIESLIEAGGETKSINNRTSSIRRDLKGDLLADMKVTKVTPKDIDAWASRVQKRAQKTPQAKTGARAKSAARERLVTVFNRAGVVPNPVCQERAHATKKMRVESGKGETQELYSEEEMTSRLKAILGEMEAGWIPQDPSDMILMLVMTSQRSGEVINARWPQIDLKRAIWNIPGDQPGNKSGRPHTEALTNAMMIMLQRRHANRREDCDLIFPSNKRGGADETYSQNIVYNYVAQYPAHLTGKSISERHGFTMTVHDLRRLAPSWCDMTPRYFWAAPFLLNHVSGQRSSVDRRYARGDMTEVIRETRQAFENWAYSLLEGQPSNVVRMEKSA